MKKWQSSKKCISKKLESNYKKKLKRKKDIQTKDLNNKKNVDKKRKINNRRKNKKIKESSKRRFFPSQSFKNKENQTNLSIQQNRENERINLRNKLAKLTNRDRKNSNVKV